jgi:hypothetical protein
MSRHILFTSCARIGPESDRTRKDQLQLYRCHMMWNITCEMYTVLDIQISVADYVRGKWAGLSNTMQYIVQSRFSLLRALRLYHHCQEITVCLAPWISFVTSHTWWSLLFSPKLLNANVVNSKNWQWPSSSPSPLQPWRHSHAWTLTSKLRSRLKENWLSFLDRLCSGYSFLDANPEVPGSIRGPTKFTM